MISFSYFSQSLECLLQSVTVYPVALQFFMGFFFLVCLFQHCLILVL